MKRFYGLVAMGLILGLASGASAHIGDRIYPIFELSEADLADIDLRDADITDWEDVLGDASLVTTDFFQDPHTGEGAPYDPADLDYRIWLGWNGNLGTIWMGMERIDNIYINEYAGGNLNSLWQHDSIELMLDGDHTGGDYTSSADYTWTDEERDLNNNRTAQQYLAIGDTPDGRHVGYLGKGTEWVNALPYADGGGGSTGDGPTTTIIEFFVTPFDDLIWNSPENSVPSPLFDGKIIGFQITAPDFDTAPLEYRAYHILSGQPATWRYAEHFVDGRLVRAGGDIGQVTTDSDGEEEEAVAPQAWLTPDPAEVEFSADDPAWKTFIVHTSLDSVLVRVNPSGSDLAIEVEGGPRPPTREYCPAEGNDRPRRGRQNGWGLHVKACQAGQTKILLIDYDTREVVQQYEINVEETASVTTDSDGEEEEAVAPQAWLTPDPAEVQFSADDSAWKTFTVHTSLDSVLVHANPSGSDPAIEVEGGSRPPTRAYCPAEGNDRPRRGRRDGWNLHVKACQAGQTKILLKDYDTGAVLQQYEVNVEASTSVAATTRLNPNYPNPFNSETVLSYTLPTASDIRLEVFTLNGQRVAVLHEGFQAAGYHTISMDASDLASGVYLYRLTTPEGRFVQKFTLLR